MYERRETAAPTPLRHGRACRIGAPVLGALLLGPLLLGAVLAVVPAGSASAWDECAPCAPRRGACAPSRGHHHRHDCHPGGSRSAWRRGCGAYGGTPWSQIRSRLHGAAYVRRNFVRGYFLRRYGVLFADGGHFAARPEDGLGAWLGVEPFADEETIALAAAGGAANETAKETDAPAASALPDVPVEPVDAVDRLNRAVARFHHGDYEGARADFGVVTSQRPDLAPARVGRALTAMIAADFSAAARDLERLAAQGELHPADRLLVDEVFADPARAEALVTAATTWLRFRAGDRAARLTTGWLLGLLGEQDEANAHLRQAAPGAARSALLGEPVAAPAANEGAAPLRSGPPPAPPHLPRVIAEGEAPRGA